MFKYPTKKLGEVAHYINGYAFKPTDWEDRGLPIIRIQNLNNPTTLFNHCSKPIPEKFKVTDGNLLISWSASLGTFIWNRGDALLNQHIFKVVLKDKIVSKKFLFYAVRSILEHLGDRTHGSTMKHITKRKFENLQIPVPPIEEQRRIVKKLEEILGKIEEVKTLRQEAVEETENFVRSVANQVFNKAGEGGCPEERLSELLELKNGESITKKAMVDDGKFLVYGANGVLGRLNSYRVENDTLVIGRVGSAGLVNKTEGPCWVSDNAMFVSSLDDSVDMDYLFYALNQLNLPALVKRGTQPSISQAQIKRQVISVPPLPEQRRIAEYLDRLQEKVNQLQTLQSETQEELEELEQAILAKAFSGEL